MILPRSAAAVVLYGRTFAEDGENDTFDAAARDEHAWAADCAFEVEQDYPHLLLPLIVAAMDACETPRDAAYVAAGLLENAVVQAWAAADRPNRKAGSRQPKVPLFPVGHLGRGRTPTPMFGRACAQSGRVTKA